MQFLGFISNSENTNATNLFHMQWRLYLIDPKINQTQDCRGPPEFEPDSLDLLLDLRWSPIHYFMDLCDKAEFTLPPHGLLCGSKHEKLNKTIYHVS